MRFFEDRGEVLVHERITKEELLTGLLSTEEPYVSTNYCVITIRDNILNQLEIIIEERENFEMFAKTYDIRYDDFLISKDSNIAKNKIRTGIIGFGFSKDKQPLLDYIKKSTKLVFNKDFVGAGVIKL